MGILRCCANAGHLVLSRLWCLYLESRPRRRCNTLFLSLSPITLAEPHVSTHEKLYERRIYVVTVVAGLGSIRLKAAYVHPQQKEHPWFTCSCPGVWCY